MDFPLAPAFSTETRLIVSVFQTTGTLVIALLLRLLTRGSPGRFLHYWSTAWAALVVALIALNLPFIRAQLSPASAWWPSLSVYCAFEYVFGFYLWAGCRAYCGGRELRWRDAWLLALPAAFGVVAPALLSDINSLLPFHALLFGWFCLLSLLTSLRFHPQAWQTAIGLRLLQAALAGLFLLFWHYAIVVGWVAARNPRPDLYYLHYSALYDGLVETLLAFGMVVLGTDSIRRTLELANRELAETNLRLAEASEQLAIAARTDPLTGLLNRRAYDGMLADRAGTPFTGSVAVVDLNHLKQINDVHGHAAGDAAIQLVARTLRSHFRITDPVFRLGGDEFLVVLEGGRSAELLSRLESVDAALRGLRLPGVPKAVDLIVAWGMADFDSAVEFHAAVARADQLMYECKARRKKPASV